MIDNARVRRASAMLAMALCLSGAERAARADDAEGAEVRRNTVSANPVRFALLHFQVDLERAVSDRWSLFVSPIVFHHATWYPFARAPHMTANGYGVDLGARYFFTGTAPAGFFVGPFLSAYRGEVLRSGEQTLEGYIYSPGVQAGMTWIIRRWVLSGGGGPSYGFATKEGPGTEKAEQLPHRGFWLNFRFNAGITF